MKMKCSICRNQIPPEEAPGHNAWPINDGRCCFNCNITVVIRERYRQSYERSDYAD